MSSYISAELRRIVAARADYLCEYCLIHEPDTFIGCSVDHIISEKHGGRTHPENLAYACALCNRYKGSDVGSVSRNTGVFVRFFNPRVDRWADHFLLDVVRIVTLTDIGEATARILLFNDIERLIERQELRSFGKYPSAPALARMKG
ncbi:MAG TPA: HNH endonuclease signature motif containing protein [Phycisphaerae bacterium]|jgi:hypothetical protein